MPSETERRETEQSQFPDDAPDDLETLVSPEYGEYEFTRLVRDADDGPRGGVVWESPDEEVTIMHYAASGYWGIFASELEYPDGKDYRITHAESNGSVTGLSRSDAFGFVDRYLCGGYELPAAEPSRSRQQTLSEVS